MYPFNGSADWIVNNPDHWIFEGTAMRKEDKVSGLVRWEHHGNPALEVVTLGDLISNLKLINVCLIPTDA